MRIKIDIFLTLNAMIVCGVSAWFSNGVTGVGWFVLLMFLIWSNTEQDIERDREDKKE